MTNIIDENEGGAPANCVGGGAIAGVGVGKDGEPGVSKKRKGVDVKLKYLTRLKGVSEQYRLTEATDSKPKAKPKTADKTKDKPKLVNKSGADDVSNTYASELFSRCWSVATTAHFAHLSTDSYSEHQALSTFYSEVIGAVDKFCEAYIGKYGKFITMPPLAPEMKVGEVVIAELRDWIATNKDLITDDSSIQNIIDEISELCNVTIYKLQKLK